MSRDRARHDHPRACAECGRFRCVCILTARMRLVAAEHLAGEQVIARAREIAESEDIDLIMPHAADALREALAAYDRAVEERAA